MKLEINTIKVETPLGLIEVEKASDPDYPGVYVSINGVSLVLVEYDATRKEHIIRVWDQDEPETEPHYNQAIKR